MSWMHVFRCLAAALLCLTLATEAAAQTSKLGPRIARQIETAGETEVFVIFAVPSSPEHNPAARRRAVRQARETVLPSLRAEDVRVHHQFNFVSGFTASVNARGLRQLLEHPSVLRVEPMERGSAALAQSVPQIRADAVHRRDDLGQGVTVAVLDTGVDITHPDLEGSVIAEECFCAGNCCPNGTNRQSGPGSAATSYPHGIHVTGIIVSKGIVAPTGVAPGAKVVAIKVLDDNGNGWLDDWILALDWIAANRPDIQAINMSLESNSNLTFPGHCDKAPTPNSYATAFAQALEPLRARGTLTFAASGNYSSLNEMTLPACVSAAVAVGSVTKQDVMSSFTNRDSALDLLAPGEGIISTGLGHSIQIMSGTSMATPHVTGTAALLLAIDPTLSADALEGFLKSTGVPLFDKPSGLAFPRINALAAMNAVVNVSRPLTGGGPQRSDCLVEWNVTPPEIATALPYANAVCRDNDPACDGDQIPGQCTFTVSACFNVPDRRLPSCATDAPIVAYELRSPQPPPTPHSVDAGNAAAISTALPSLPLVTQNECTASMPIVVPVGQKPGVKWIRFSATASDGRTDFDRLRLTCLPANP
jgi:Subtilase family